LSKICEILSVDPDRGEEDEPFDVKKFRKKYKILRRGGVIADYRSGGTPATSLYLLRRSVFLDRVESFSL